VRELDHGNEGFVDDFDCVKECIVPYIPLSYSRVGDEEEKNTSTDDEDDDDDFRFVM
jgi:hypothetical protein